MSVMSLVGEVKISGDAEAKDKLKSVDTAAKETSGGFKAMLGNALSFASGQAIFTAAGTAVGFLKDQLHGAFQESMDAQAELAQTNKVLQSTHDISGMTSQAIVDLSGQFSHLTKFTDDQVQTGENLLLTFTNIGKDVFPQTTRTMLDLSQAMGQDVKSSAIQLGKALNDPLTGMTALSRVGVTFDETEKKLIKTYMAHNELAKAQGVILGELQKEFGGSAEAAGKTFGGQLAILHQRMDDIKQQVGDALLPIVSQFITFVSQQAAPALDKFGAAFGKISGYLDEAKAAWKAVFDPGPLLGVVHAAAPLLDTFDRASAVLGKVHTAAKPLLDTFDRATAVLHGTGHETGVLLDTFDRATAIIKPLHMTVNPLVGVFEQLKPVFAEAGRLWGQLVGIWHEATPILGNVVAIVEKFALGIFSAFQKGGLLHTILKTIKDILPDVGTFVQKVGGYLLNNLLPPMEQLITTVQNTVANFLTWLDTSGTLSDVLSFLGDTLGVMSQILGWVIQQAADLFGWFTSGGPQTYILVGAVAALGTAFLLLKIADVVSGFGKWFGEMKSGDGLVSNLAGSFKDKLSSTIDEFLKTHAPNFKQFLDDVKSKGKDASDSVGKIGSSATTAEGEVKTAAKNMKTDIATNVEAGAAEAEVAEAGIGTEAKATAGVVETEATGMKTSLGGVLGLLTMIATIGVPFVAQKVQDQRGPLQQQIDELKQRGQPIPPYLRQAAHDAGVPGFARGGLNFTRGGWGIVGENGPEPMYIPQGASILPNSVLQAGAASSGAQSGPIYLQMDGVTFAQLFMPHWTQAVRSNLGVQF